MQYLPHIILRTAINKWLTDLRAEVLLNVVHIEIQNYYFRIKAIYIQIVKAHFN